MNKVKLISAIAIVFLLLSGPGCTDEEAASKSGKAQTTGTDAVNLRCEYLVNPMGIDVVEPRLSWILKSGRRAETQSAYQILVASSDELLEQDKGDLWNNGKVKSDRSNQVVY
jgi:hypothetical protein